MLQFEFNIRDYKIANNPFKGRQLLLGLGFLFLATFLLFLQISYELILWNFLPVALLLVLSFYFLGLRWGAKALYPKEYLIINSRKIVYRIGRGAGEKKIYRKNIQRIVFRTEEMIVLQKDTTETHVDISHLSTQAREVLKSYLEL
ncbi:MAG: hypothetical protein ACEPOZ_18835 [Marinifilaceae bacterium]